MCSYGSFNSLLCHKCLCYYIVLFIIILSSVCLYVFCFPLFSTTVALTLSLVITDPTSEWETLILKLGSGGLPPALSPCVYFAASPPRSLSMTPGDDWVCCFHPWCRSDVHFLLHLCLSLSSHPSLFSSLSLPLFVLISSVWSGVSFALPRY